LSGHGAPDYELFLCFLCGYAWIEGGWSFGTLRNAPSLTVAFRLLFVTAITVQAS
jgi:hypothetical protein